MGKITTALKLGTTMAVTVCVGCGGDGEPSINHLTSVADPDPQTPFFNESSMNSLSSLGDITSDWISDLSKVMPTNSTTAKTSPAPAKARSIMAVDPQLDCQSGNIRTRGLDNPENFRATITFNNCDNEGVLTNGSVSVSGRVLQESQNSDFGSANVAVTFNNLRVSGQESASVNGDISIDVEDDAQQFRLNITGNVITTMSDGQTNTLRNYRLAMSEIQGLSTASLDMVLHSSKHGSITFETSTPLTGNETDDNPTSGKFTMTHSDGSYLIIDADSGNPDTFSYTVFNGSSTTSGDTQWSEFEVLDSLDQSL